MNCLAHVRIAVVLLNALSFASLAYLANRKGFHTMAALAAGAWLFGVTGGAARRIAANIAKLPELVGQIRRSK